MFNYFIYIPLSLFLSLPRNFVFISFLGGGAMEDYLVWFYCHIRMKYSSHMKRYYLVWMLSSSNCGKSMTSLYIEFTLLK